MISYVKVRWEDRDRGRVAFVTVDNVAKLNSLSSEVMKQLSETVESLADDPALRALVLSGAGEKSFIGGADIAEMSSLNATSARAFIERLHRCCSVLQSFPVPVIARINGWCLGAGLVVAAACDLRAASDSAMFGMPEVKLGVPSTVEAALLPHLIGWGHAREMLLTGKILSAADAARRGLVENMVPLAKLDAAVEDWIDLILAAEPRAVRLQKVLLHRWESLPIGEAISAGVESFVDAWATDEPVRAMETFIARQARRAIDQTIYEKALPDET